MNLSYEGAPVWGWMVGALVLHFEYWLARTEKVNARSTLELLPNMLLALGGRFIPGLNIVLAKLGSGMPTPAAPTPPATPETPSEPPAPPTVMP